MDDLQKVADAAAAFAARAKMIVVPALPVYDTGPEVRIQPDRLALESFLTLAAKLGSGVLYLHAEPFDPSQTNGATVDVPPHLAKRKGAIGTVGVAFAVNGLVHYWQQTTPWFGEWQILLIGGRLMPFSRDGEPDQGGQNNLDQESGDVSLRSSPSPCSPCPTSEQPRTTSDRGSENWLCQSHGPPDRPPGNPRGRRPGR